MRRILGLAIMVSAMAGRAQAQPSDASALAEQLFNQARELAKDNRWAEACPKFEASLRIDPVLGTRLNLATCYERIGKLASAWGLYRESIELARKAGDLKRHDYAQQQADALEPRLPRLALAAPSPRPAGFVVTRDGTPIAAGALGVALYVDPGEHEVTASAPGFEAFTQTITLVPGKAETLVIPDLKPAPEAALSVSPAKSPATSPKTSAIDGRVATTEPAPPMSPRRKYTAIGLGGAGVAAIGVGLLFGAKASSAFQDAKALCSDDLVCAPESYDQGKQRTRDARASATASTVLVAAGGAAIAAGAIVILTRPRTRERAMARIVPVTHNRGAGLAILGRF
jgi:tetratricopeptide (TPR) repeat protein